MLYQNTVLLLKEHRQLAWLCLLAHSVVLLWRNYQLIPDNLNILINRQPAATKMGAVKGHTRNSFSLSLWTSDLLCNFCQATPSTLLWINKQHLCTSYLHYTEQDINAVLGYSLCTTDCSFNDHKPTWIAELSKMRKIGSITRKWWLQSRQTGSTSIKLVASWYAACQLYSKSGLNSNISHCWMLGGCIRLVKNPKRFWVGRKSCF